MKHLFVTHQFYVTNYTFHEAGMLNSVKIILFAIVMLAFFQGCKSDPASSSERTLKTEFSGQLPIGNKFYSIEFIDENTGWAAGKEGVICKTTNGGESWQYQSSGTTDNLGKVQFTDARTGWIAGEKCVLFTSDGGKTWQTKLSGLSFGRFAGMNFSDANTGWISGTPDGKIYHTSDCGKTWQTQQVDTISSVYEISFVNPSVGYALTNVRGIYKTTDGGRRWNKISTPRFCTTLFALNESFAAAGNNILPSSYAPDKAEIFVTADGGHTWKNKTIPEATAVWKIIFTDNLTGFAIAGGLGSFGGGASDWVGCGDLLYTSDGGNNWKTAEGGLSGKWVVDFTVINKKKLCILTTEGRVYFADIQ